jgi:hypothetical protein
MPDHKVRLTGNRPQKGGAMSLIVAGRFTTFPTAERAAQALFASGFVHEDVTLFFVNPPGQHARYAIGGDVGTDPGARDAPKGAAKGTAIGAVAGAVVGVAIFALASAPVVVSIIAAGVGAYLGSMIGAMANTRRALGRQREHERFVNREARDAGVLVAVHVDASNQANASRVLREAGALDIERASGRWTQGRWSDFDPTRAPHIERDTSAGLSERHT